MRQAMMTIAALLVVAHAQAAWATCSEMCTFDLVDAQCTPLPTTPCDGESCALLAASAAGQLHVRARCTSQCCAPPMCSDPGDPSTCMAACTTDEDADPSGALAIRDAQDARVAASFLTNGDVVCEPGTSRSLNTPLTPGRYTFVYTDADSSETTIALSVEGEPAPGEMAPSTQAEPDADDSGGCSVVRPGEVVAPLWLLLLGLVSLIRRSPSSRSLCRLVDAAGRLCRSATARRR